MTHVSECLKETPTEPFYRNISFARYEQGTGFWLVTNEPPPNAPEWGQSPRSRAQQINKMATKMVWFGTLRQSGGR